MVTVTYSLLHSSIRILPRPGNVSGFGRERMRREGAMSRTERARRRPPAPGAGDPDVTMAWIEGGTFHMGSDRHYPEEAPIHRVRIDGFWMDRTPVTNRQFRAFVEATGKRDLYSGRTVGHQGMMPAPAAGRLRMPVRPPWPFPWPPRRRRRKEGGAIDRGDRASWSGPDMLRLAGEPVPHPCHRPGSTGRRNQRPTPGRRLSSQRGCPFRPTSSPPSRS